MRYLYKTQLTASHTYKWCQVVMDSDPRTVECIHNGSLPLYRCILRANRNCSDLVIHIRSVLKPDNDTQRLNL